jgi:hypothetical protein
MSTVTDIINIDYLPDGLRDLIDVVGLEPALAFVKKFGGVRYAVPKKLSEQHELARLMGFDAAQKMVDMYRGEYLVFPKYDAAAMQVRHYEVKVLDAKGESTRNIALQTGYTERMVNYLKAKARNAEQEDFGF